MSKIDHSASDNQDKNDLKLCGDKVKTNSNYFRSRQRKSVCRTINQNVYNSSLSRSKSCFFFILKIYYFQINLEIRPLNKLTTASSKCSLLTKCYSRPASALPILNLEDKVSDT